MEVPKQGQSKVLNQGFIDVCFHFNKVFSVSLALAMRRTKHMSLNLFTHGEALVWPERVRFYFADIFIEHLFYEKIQKGPVCIFLFGSSFILTKAISQVFFSILGPES